MLPSEKKPNFASGSLKTGLTFGSCLAMIISYAAWKSIFWAILHGLFSWGYVIYYAIRYTGQ